MKIEIPAIANKDLRKILDRFSLSEKIDTHKLFCPYCTKIISWEDIGLIKIEEGELLIICDNINCIENSQK